MKRNDLTGKRFGKLVAVKGSYDREKKVTLWECKCDCGKICYVRQNRLSHGRTKSCGCLRQDTNIQKNTTHGMTKTRMYNAWHSMKARCLNPNAQNYPRYGGRGITICDEWKNSFESFSKWAIANGYKDGLTLDRIDNDGNYCPENCRWVTTNIQNNNRGVSINVTYDGRTQNLSEWCKEFGLPYLRTWERIKLYGYTFEEAVTEPNYNRCGKQKKEMT